MKNPDTSYDVLLMQTCEDYIEQATYFTMHDLVHNLAVLHFCSLAMEFWIRANKAMESQFLLRPARDLQGHLLELLPSGSLSPTHGEWLASVCPLHH